MPLELLAMSTCGSPPCDRSRAAIQSSAVARLACESSIMRSAARVGRVPIRADPGKAFPKNGFVANELGTNELPTPMVRINQLVTACADASEYDSLRYYKMGEGPFYVFERPYHLCALEISKTIREALRGASQLLNNGSQPTVSIAAISKRDLVPGQRIRRGMGGFDLRGEALVARSCPGHLPLGIIFDAVVTRHIPAGSILHWEDVELPDSLAMRLTRELLRG